MPGVSYALADFVTGGSILDLPVREGADWTAQLNRPDTLGCTVSLRDAEARDLDLRAASEPKKTVLVARTDADVILAWGIVDDDRVWDEDARTVTLTAKGIWSSYFGSTLIGPPSALSQPLTIAGVPNPLLSTHFSGYTLATIGKKIVEQRLTWPGSPTIALPPDEVGTHEETYEFASFKKVGPALTDLTNRENGPDFAFDAARGPDGLSLVYSMRHGTNDSPIGTDLGSWYLGGDSPITGLKFADNATDLASAAWGSAGRSAGEALLSRALNDSLVTADGYPSLDYVGPSRSTVTNQDTLESYTEADRVFASRPYRSLSFNLRTDVFPFLGGIRPGDTVTIDAPADHPWITGPLRIRITSVSGDVAGRVVKVGCILI